MLTGRQRVLRDLPLIANAIRQMPVGRVYSIREVYGDAFADLDHRHGINQALASIVRNGDVFGVRSHRYARDTAHGRSEFVVVSTVNANISWIDPLIQRDLAERGEPPNNRTDIQERRLPADCLFDAHDTFELRYFEGGYHRFRYFDSREDATTWCRARRYDQPIEVDGSRDEAMRAKGS